LNGRRAQISSVGHKLIYEIHPWSLLHLFFLGDHEIGSKEIINYCYTILEHSLLSFIYQFIVNDGPNPFESDKFCNEFKKKNVSIIVVEMATESITVATKDKKFTFESQVSAIGKNPSRFS
jgi:hypothetical protein